VLGRVDHLVDSSEEIATRILLDHVAMAEIDHSSGKTRESKIDRTITTKTEEMRRQLAEAEAARASAEQLAAATAIELERHREQMTALTDQLRTERAAREHAEQQLGKAGDEHASAQLTASAQIEQTQRQHAEELSKLRARLDRQTAIVRLAAGIIVFVIAITVATVPLATGWVSGGWGWVLAITGAGGIGFLVCFVYRAASGDWLPRSEAVNTFDVHDDARGHASFNAASNASASSSVRFGIASWSQDVMTGTPAISSSSVRGIQARAIASSIWSDFGAGSDIASSVYARSGRPLKGSPRAPQTHDFGEPPAELSATRSHYSTGNRAAQLRSIHPPGPLQSRLHRFDSGRRLWMNCLQRSNFLRRGGCPPGAAQGREVGVTPEMLVAPAEQLSRDRSSRPTGRCRFRRLKQPRRGRDRSAPGGAPVPAPLRSQVWRSRRPTSTSGRPLLGEPSRSRQTGRGGTTALPRLGSRAGCRSRRRLWPQAAPMLALALPSGQRWSRTQSVTPHGSATWDGRGIDRADHPLLPVHV
jgi:hypothetical protein